MLVQELSPRLTQPVLEEVTLRLLVLMMAALFAEGLLEGAGSGSNAFGGTAARTCHSALFFIIVTIVVCDICHGSPDRGSLLLLLLFFLLFLLAGRTGIRSVEDDDLGATLARDVPVILLLDQVDRGGDGPGVLGLADAGDTGPVEGRSGAELG